MKAFAAALGLALLAAQDQPPRDGKIHAGIGSRFFNQRPAHPAIVLDPCHVAPCRGSVDSKLVL